MPEGPEVTLQSRALNFLLSGRRLLGLTIFSGAFSDILKKQVEALNILAGQHVVKFDYVRNKGKYIYFQISSDKGVKYFGNHLNMYGNWRTKKSKHTRLSIQYGDISQTSQTIYFDDRLGTGKFVILNTPSMQKQLNEIGPDILRSETTEEVFISKMKPLMKSRKSIVNVLADQHVISGIGNYLRADILYVAHIDPRKPMNMITGDQLLVLFSAAKTVCEKSLSMGGTIIETYPGENSPITDKLPIKIGKYEPLVYGRKKDNKNNVVEPLRVQNRTVYWVPSIQH